MAAKDTKAPERKIDSAILSKEEIEAVQFEALAEIEKEAKDAAKKQLKARLVAEERQKTGLDEPQVQVTIDLAPYCDRILLDNVAYLQGLTYTVRQGVAIGMYEMMQKTWNHQAEVDGKSENFYRRTRGTRILPGGGVVSTTQILRA